MQDEETFIRSYCHIAGVGESSARCAYILFDALHEGSRSSHSMPGTAPLARAHVSAVSRKAAPSRAAR